MVGREFAPRRHEVIDEALRRPLANVPRLDSYFRANYAGRPVLARKSGSFVARRPCLAETEGCDLRDLDADRGAPGFTCELRRRLDHVRNGPRGDAWTP